MKGVYVLLIEISKAIQEKTGRLGKIKFAKGTYAYVGSAQNNLEKRIARHKSRNKRIFWHIDYLLNSKYAKILKVFYKKAGKKEECKTANKLSSIGVPKPGFGCSDCNCRSHLFKVNKWMLLVKLRGFKEW